MDNNSGKQRRGSRFVGVPLAVYNRIGTWSAMEIKVVIASEIWQQHGIAAYESAQRYIQRLCGLTVAQMRDVKQRLSNRVNKSDTKMAVAVREIFEDNHQLSLYHELAELNELEEGVVELDGRMLYKMPNAGVALSLYIYLLHHMGTGRFVEMPVADYCRYITKISYSATFVANQRQQLARAVAVINALTDYSLTVTDSRIDRRIVSWGITNDSALLAQAEQQTQQDWRQSDCVTKTARRLGMNVSEEALRLMARFFLSYNEYNEAMSHIAERLATLVELNILQNPDDRARYVMREAIAYDHADQSSMPWFSQRKGQAVLLYLIRTGRMAEFDALRVAEGKSYTDLLNRYRLL